MRALLVRLFIHRNKLNNFPTSSDALAIIVGRYVTRENNFNFSTATIRIATFPITITTPIAANRTENHHNLLIAVFSLYSSNFIFRPIDRR